MKKIFFLTMSILISGMTAHACPNLEGSYKCAYSEPDYDGRVNSHGMSISQDDNIYTITDGDTLAENAVFVADGTTRKIDGLDITVSCKKDKLVLEADNHSTGFYFIKTEQTLSISDGVLTKISKNWAGPDSVFTQEYVCAKYN